MLAQIHTTRMFFLIIILSFAVFGQTTYTWTSDNSGWNSSLNWSPSGVPGPSDTAIVNSGLVILDDNITVGGLVLTDGNITGSNSLTINGKMRWEGGIIEPGDSLYIPFGAELNINGTSSVLLDGRPISNAGDIVWDGTGNIRVKNGAVINNKLGGDFNIETDAEIEFSIPSGGTIVNSGVITKLFSFGTTPVEIALENTGNIVVISGTLEFKGGTSASLCTFATNNNGSIAFREGNHTWDNVNFTGGGDALINDAEVTVNSGGLTLQSGMSLILDGGDGLISGSGDALINGVFDWRRGTVAGSGSFIINGEIQIGGTNTKTLDGRTITNVGSASWLESGTWRFINNAMFINDTNATMDIQVDALLDFLDNGGGTFINYGTLSKSAGNGNSTFDVPFNNNGTVNITSGNLALTRGGASTNGSYNLSASTALNFSGGTHDINDATFDGGGTVQITSNTVNFNGSQNLIQPTCTLSVTGGIMSGNGLVTVSGPMTWSGGTITGDGSFVSSGHLDMDGTSTKTIDGKIMTISGTATWANSGKIGIKNNGEFNVANGGYFEIQNDSDFDFVSPGGGTVENNGTIRKTSSGATGLEMDFTNNGLLDVQNGTFELQENTTSTNGNYRASTLGEIIFNEEIHTFDGTTFSGNGGFSEFDNGTVNINGNGITVADSGWLVVNGSSALLDGSGEIVINGLLQWERGTIAGSGGITINGTLETIGGSSRTLDGNSLTNNNLFKWNNTGTLRLTNGASFLNSTNGTLEFQTDGVLDHLSPSGGTLNNLGNIIKSSGTGKSIVDLETTNAGNVTINSGTLEFTRGGSSNTGTTFTMAPDATLEFDGGFFLLNSVSFSGGTVLQSSNTLNIDSNGALVTPDCHFIINGGSLEGEGLLAVLGIFDWQRGNLSGNGQIIIEGIMDINGDNLKTLDGKTLLNKGSGLWRGDGEIRLTNSAQLINDTLATLEIQNTRPLVYSNPGGGSMTNHGSIIKTNANGTTRIEVDFLNYGLLDVSNTDMTFEEAFTNYPNSRVRGSGTLDMSDAIFQNDGDFEPGTGTTSLNFIGDFNQSTSSILDIEIGGMTAGTDHDEFVVLDSVSLAGTINVTAVNGFSPEIGDSFVVITHNGRTGEFSNVTSSAPGGASAFQVVYHPNQVVVKAVRNNNLPILGPDTRTIMEDDSSTLNVLLNDTDPDGDPLTIADIIQSANGLATLVGDSTIKYIPNENFFGADTFYYVVSDGFGALVNGTVVMDVLAVNDLTDISGIPDTLTFATNQNAALDVWAAVNDPETADSLLSYSFQSSNNSVTADFNSLTGLLTLAAQNSFQGTISLNVEITDDDNATVQKSVTVIVTGPVGVEPVPQAALPSQFELSQNYPNPFNPETRISFQLPEAADVQLIVYNMLGQQVRVLVNNHLSPGFYESIWNGQNDYGIQLASGVYIYRLVTPTFQKTLKMTLIR